MQATKAVLATVEGMGSKRVKKASKNKVTQDENLKERVKYSTRKKLIMGQRGGAGQKQKRRCDTT